MNINGRKYTNRQFTQVYHDVYDDLMVFDDRQEYIKELDAFAKEHGLHELKDIMKQHGIENGYILIYTKERR